MLNKGKLDKFVFLNDYCLTVPLLFVQAPDKFAAAVARNPVCNLALMVGTTDIPDWCYAETFGDKGKSNFTEAPSAEHLDAFHRKSPILHVSKVCASVKSGFDSHSILSYLSFC